MYMLVPIDKIFYFSAKFLKPRPQILNYMTMIRKVKNSCKKISLLHLWHSTQTVGLSFGLLFFHFDLEITLLHYWFLNKKKNT